MRPVDVLGGYGRSGEPTATKDLTNGPMRSALRTASGNSRSSSLRRISRISRTSLSPVRVGARPAPAPAPAPQQGDAHGDGQPVPRGRQEVRLDREPEVGRLDPVHRREPPHLAPPSPPVARKSRRCSITELLNTTSNEPSGNSPRSVASPARGSMFACMRSSASRLTSTTSHVRAPGPAALLPERVGAADVEDAHAACRAASAGRRRSRRTPRSGVFAGVGERAVRVGSASRRMRSPGRRGTRPIALTEVPSLPNARTATAPR